MKLIANDQNGWEQLYYDEAAEAYFEKTYPDGEMQGGGEPYWRPISKEEAFTKYVIE
ncbi:Imm27 family immunity protein [Asticcacaulis taihuensis]|uniref:Immunity protein 27 n=1 Tax=Asticcacaulis taihuensis TaxID=260084 RepID=A0A1G4TQ65_9CAUL|nr:Imm27 family immunity protein [Asticcacaulis taihuensis]SCW82915.1 Immunity protein 27 [Asticcacaulis taihuensis]